MQNHPSAVDVVQRQLDAYNAHDLAAFVATYAEDIQLWRPPVATPAIVGRSQLAEFYATQRFCLPGLKADLVGRMAVGNKVIDHERISGLSAVATEVVAVYEVTEGLIGRVWLFPSQ